MAGSTEHRDLRRRRQSARLSLLKRRSALASVLGFAALFGLAGQHTVKGSGNASTLRSPAVRASAAPTTFFDEQGDGFAFDDQGGVGLSGSAVSPDPPVTQTSVS